MTSVQGHCPACGWQSLVCGTDGYITCTRLECPRPTAADELLDDDETEHIVQFDETMFTVRHPLRERLGDALMTCQLHEYIAALDGLDLGAARQPLEPTMTTTLPPFPVDDTTLDLLEATMDPWSHGHPNAESSHLWVTLDTLSTLGGKHMRDPRYEEHAVITALIAEVRRLRSTGWLIGC